ncbi:MAG: DUF167 domain-containing protein [Novosphingobium sp.]
MLDQEGRVAVRATPGASREAVTIAEGRLTVHVRAIAEGGKANAAVLALVAKAAGVAPSRVTLLRGAGSREKLLLIEV